MSLVSRGILQSVEIFDPKWSEGHDPCRPKHGLDHRVKHLLGFPGRESTRS
jgi:hypothetical protein